MEQEKRSLLSSYLRSASELVKLSPTIPSSKERPTQGLLTKGNTDGLMKPITGSLLASHAKTTNESSTGHRTNPDSEGCEVPEHNDEVPDYRSHYEHPRVPTMLAELPPKTRQWLADKREADLVLLDKLIETQRTMQTMGRISKWLFISLIAFIIAMGEVGQAFTRMITFLGNWTKGGG